MCDSSEINLATQTRLVMALFESCQPLHAAGTVRLIETHISWVLLAGPYAYKFKKALNPGFLDFTKLERRRFFCEEEIRLNRRLAPKIYLDVVPIGGTTENPVFGTEPAIEYAVRMRRFPPSTEMDRLMARGMVLPAHVDSLANILSKFHQSLQSVPAELPYGAGAKMRDLALQNFEQLPESLLDTVGKFVVAALQHATEEEYADCEMTIESRRRQGFVRECHGDLHLGNIIIKGGKAVPFDCIEFDPALRHIDVICDIYQSHLSS